MGELPCRHGGIGGGTVEGEAILGEADALHAVGVELEDVGALPWECRRRSGGLQSETLEHAVVAGVLACSSKG